MYIILLETVWKEWTSAHHPRILTYGGELLFLSICMHEEPGGNLFVSEAIYVI